MSRITTLNNLCKNYKIIQDKIHGMINISQLAIIIIDTPIFQRLRNLKQLGVCYLVFPNAVHTRFEHSIGAYHLAKKLLNNLIINSEQEELTKPLHDITELHKYFTEKYSDKNNVNLDDYVKELVCIAAICHDLGHGPFSHVFDDKFLPLIQDKYNIEKYKHHEDRSCILLRKIINSTILKDLILAEEVEFMCSLINGKRYGYLYQIVSNSLNGLDVDKYDYLTRDSMSLGINIAFSPDKLINNAKVIDNIIAYPKHIDSDLINLFTTRHYMHRKIYSHKVVISIDLLICNLMKLLDGEATFAHELNIGRIIENIEINDDFNNLTDDDILIRAKYSNNSDIKNLVNRIITHNFYPILTSETLYYDINIDKHIEQSLHTLKFNANQINFDDYDENKLLITYHTIGYTNSKNPLEEIYVYANKDNKLYNLTEFGITKLLPEHYQEIILMIFYNGCKYSPEISKYKELFDNA